MNISREQKIEKSIELLKQLNIHKPYINGFKNNPTNNVCYFEFYGGYWVYQRKDVLDKMLEIENEYNCKVYAITHEMTGFGECYSFMIITDYKREWKDLLVKNDNTYYAFAYVWNKTYELDSEFGTIGVKSFGGGLKRIY